MKIKKVYIVEYDVESEIDVMDTWTVEDILNGGNLDESVKSITVYPCVVKDGQVIASSKKMERLIKWGILKKVA